MYPKIKTNSAYCNQYSPITIGRKYYFNNIVLNYAQGKNIGIDDKRPGQIGNFL